jgi:hypothetical protein
MLAFWRKRRGAQTLRRLPLFRGGPWAALVCPCACGSSDQTAGSGGSDAALADRRGPGSIVGQGDGAATQDGEAMASEGGPVLTNPCIEAGNCTPPVSCGALSSVVGT